MRPREHYNYDKRRDANEEEGSKRRQGGQRVSHKQSNALLLRGAIWRRACVAFDTRQQAADDFGPAICSDDPRPVAPRWIMPDVLVVAALELSYPVLLIVLMEADNAALHGCSLVAQRRSSADQSRPPRLRTSGGIARRWVRWNARLCENSSLEKCASLESIG